MAAADKVQQMIQARKMKRIQLPNNGRKLLQKKDKIVSCLGDPENNFPPRTLTFNDVDAIANQVAHWALEQGLKGRYSCTVL